MKCPKCTTEATRCWQLFIHLRGAHWPSVNNVNWEQLKTMYSKDDITKLRKYYFKHGR